VQVPSLVLFRVTHGIVSATAKKIHEVTRTNTNEIFAIQSFLKSVSIR